MNTRINAAPRWSTSSFSDTADTSPMELSALGDHLAVCKGDQGRLFTLHCAADRMHGYVASRFVTTMTVATLLIGIVSLAT